MRTLTRLAACLTLAACPALSFAQAAGAAAAVAEQRSAMARLAFLVGQWRGPATIQRGPGEPLHLTQTEHVSMKLDGLVMLIEGDSTDSTGKAVFRALATVSYDESAKTYHFRAYNDGRYLDVPLTVTPDGFQWSYNAGGAQVANTMHLSSSGEWTETTDSTYGSRPPMRVLNMTLAKQP